MSRSVVFAAALLIVSVSSAGAYENFIPLGHNYSPDQSELPPLNSEQDQINAQVDIYEAENYTRQLNEKLFSSELDRYSQGQDLGAHGGEFRDY